MNDLNKYIGVIIKPDSIKEKVDSDIYLDIIKDGFIVKLEKILQIETNQVPFIYPDKVNTDRYPYSHYSITNGPSKLLLLEKNNAYKDFAILKGDSYSKGGIREKYRKKTKEQLELEGKKGPELEYILCQNKIHSSDNIEETVLMLVGLLNDKEIQKIKGFSYLLYNEIYKLLTKNINGKT